MRRIGWLAVALACACVARAETVAELNAAFWQWRTTEQPFTTDDIPRVERPVGFRVDWRPETVAARQRELRAFEARWRACQPAADAAVAEQVDWRLTGSAVARVKWELEIERGWRRNPEFYVDQTLGSVYALLLPPGPFGEARQKALVERMRGIPATVTAAETNLTEMRRPFAKMAVDELAGLRDRMQTVLAALGPELAEGHRREMTEATAAAVTALEGYRAWVQARMGGAAEDTAVGRERYVWFLRNVALMPYTPEQLLAMSRQAWSRAVAFETYAQNRTKGQPEPEVFGSQQAQMAAEAKDELAVRKFLTEKGILTGPGWMQHYRNLPEPAYVTPLDDLGVTDDLTGPGRLNEDGTSYIKPPSESLPFFNRSTAQDPRPILVHEGIPGHYFQLCLGWKSADAVRRHYYDSGANEGIGFYAEEMMLQEGFFDDSLATKSTIYSFMRLRALRVEVDVRLALGEFTREQAAEYLEKTVPMDRATALDEAAFFASAPGQAISYQIGKLQITGMLADARRTQGKDFDLLRFNDFVWGNGNVPLSLQRWEMLGDRSEVPEVEVK